MNERVVQDFKTSLVSMKYARAKISILEDKVSVLMNENQNLKIRAAISFDELTPRPSFDKVQ